MAAGETYTEEEINGFFKITRFRTEYFTDIIEKEKKRYAEAMKEKNKQKEKKAHKTLVYSKRMTTFAN